MKLKLLVVVVVTTFGFAWMTGQADESALASGSRQKVVAAGQDVNQQDAVNSVVEKVEGPNVERVEGPDIDKPEINKPDVDKPEVNKLEIEKIEIEKPQTGEN